MEKIAVPCKLSDNSAYQLLTRPTGRIMGRFAQDGKRNDLIHFMEIFAPGHRT